MNAPEFNIGDKVRVRATDEMIHEKLADKIGKIFMFFPTSDASQACRVEFEDGRTRTIRAEHLAIVAENPLGL